MKKNASVLVGFLASANHEASDMLRRALPEGWGLLTSEGNADRPQFADRLAGLDYIVSAVMPFQRRHVERASRLRLLHKIGVGYNELGPHGAAGARHQSGRLPRRGIGCRSGTRACADARRHEVHPQPGQRAAHEQMASWSYRTRIRSLAGRRVGIVGFGRIGQPTAALFVAFGCHVEVFSRTRPISLPEPFNSFQEQGVLSFTDDLDGLFERCSVVSLHAPLTDATRNLVTEAMLEKLGPEGVFINTARGALVDEAALARTLSDGRLGCAGLDVFREEPATPNPGLLACPNVVLSPHVAGGGNDVLERKAGFIMQNLKGFHETGTARELLSF